MIERRTRTRRQKLLGVIPAMLVYLAVVTVGPWLHLQVHDAADVATVTAESTTPESGSELADVCELCRVLGGHAPVFTRTLRAVAPKSAEEHARASLAAPRPASATGQPRAPPAISLPA